MSVGASLEPEGEARGAFLEREATAEVRFIKEKEVAK
jgi:hypothetical protein